MNLGNLTTGELLALTRAILRELRERGVVRTGNAPAGDYAELLVQQATGGKLAANSERSWDVRTPDCNRLQVKARVVVDPTRRSERELSVFRSWDFDAAVAVLFDDDFRVWRAVRLPVEVVRDVGSWIEHVRGWRVMATDELLDRGEDWSERLRQAAALPSPAPTFRSPWHQDSLSSNAASTSGSAAMMTASASLSISALVYFSSGRGFAFFRSSCWSQSAQATGNW